MNQKIYILFGILILLVVGVTYYINPTPPPENEVTNVSSPSPGVTVVPGTTKLPGESAPPIKKGSGTVTPIPSKTSSANGRVVFTITDKAAQLAGMRSVLISIEGIWVNHEKLGWREIKLGSPKIYDLLQLRQSGVLKLLKDVSLPTGTYTEVRLKIGTVTVIPNIGEAKAPKILLQDIKFFGRFTANANDTAVVVLDFLLDKSLHATVNDSYIFAPVISLRSQNKTIVEITSAEDVKVGGGSTGFTIDIGVDENGMVRQGYALNPNLLITILTGGSLKLLNPGESDQNFSVSAEQAIQLAQSGGYLTSARGIRILNDSQNTYWVVSGFKSGIVTTAKVNVKTGAVVN